MQKSHSIAAGKRLATTADKASGGWPNSESGNDHHGEIPKIYSAYGIRGINQFEK